jgi:hypothetical protein
MRPKLHLSYDVEPRPASAEGTLPDVRGRRAGAYRLCTHGMLPFWHDFWHGRGADEGASLGRRSRVGSKGEPDL